MKHCEGCKCKDPKEEMLWIPEHGFWVDKKVTQLGIPFNKLEMNGKELMTVEEAFWLINSKYAKELDMEITLDNNMKYYFWIKQPIENYEGKYASPLVGTGRAVCNWVPSGSYVTVGFRGVIREVKK